jgi:hypothetical protein
VGGKGWVEGVVFKPENWGIGGEYENFKTEIGGVLQAWHWNVDETMDYHH